MGEDIMNFHSFSKHYSDQGLIFFFFTITYFVNPKTLVEVALYNSQAHQALHCEIQSMQNPVDWMEESLFW